MERNYPVNEINPDINYVTFSEGKLIIGWSGRIGYGQYVFTKTAYDEFAADSECMDSLEDTEFGQRLLELLKDYITKHINQVK